MRVLFSFVGGRGHFEPLVPIARAAAAAGHDVVFTCRPLLVPAVEDAGLAVVPTPGDVSGQMTRKPLRPVDLEKEDRDLRGFAERHGRVRAAGILELCGGSRPDLIVCDETDFGAMIAAERLGLPYASVVVIAAGSFVRRAVVGDALQAVRVENGLPRDPGLAMLSRYLVLSPVPPSFRDPACPLPATGHSIRPLVPVLGGEPPWPVRRRGEKTVYFTLGTAFTLESGDLFTRVLDGLRELPVEVVVTVGGEVDPAELGPQPPHVHVERFLPQSRVLPHVDAVVSHGGSGSVVGALAHGLPLVVIPMGADQPANAGRCESLGVGRALDAVEATPDDVREAVATVLEDASYREAAERLRDEAAALPGPAHAVSLLERLARERRPVTRA